MKGMAKTTAMALGLAAMAAAAAPAMAADQYSSRSYLVAHCEGDGYEAKVTRSSSGYLTLTVYDWDGTLVRAYATKRTSYAGGVETTTYDAGSIWDGGASLRIRTYDERIPDNEGSAHLTVRNGGATVNPLLYCDVY